MTNSDNRFGTFNKRTQILTQINDGSTALQNNDDWANNGYTTEEVDSHLF